MKTVEPLIDNIYTSDNSHVCAQVSALAEQSIDELLTNYPFIEDFFTENRLHDLGVFDKTDLTFAGFLDSIHPQAAEDAALDKAEMYNSFFDFIIQMKEFLDLDDSSAVHSIRILPGTDKSGTPESFSEITLYRSEIIAIVGPTGSGKSRLLADIEWAARGDTPTKRSVLVNDKIPDKAVRFSANNSLVAQLSQNMNFVMDLTVEEFIRLHAESRLVENKDEAVCAVLEEANRLAGESFKLQTPVTVLSGGQSRSLMIADTAILSSSPIVLIDEIENAGIDRKKALELLVSKEKIVLMATHDPALALYADRRIVIKNGGIAAVLETSAEEKALLAELEHIDEKLYKLRAALRNGERVG